MHIFDAALGLFHYLVCPVDDSYILNSLEKLSFEEYMYRLLREGGYDRIISFELNPGRLEFTVHAYDKLSYYSYMNPAIFDKLHFPQNAVRLPEGREVIKRFYSQVEKTLQPEANKGPQGMIFKPKRAVASPGAVIRETGKIQTAIEVKQLTAEIQNRMVPALNSTRLKTAILFPVSIFQEETGIGFEAAKLFYLVEPQHNNIVVFYADNENALSGLSSVVFTKSDFPANIEWERVKDGLGRRFFKSRDLTEDEIRNLLLRKIIIECDPDFDVIPFDKIEGAAEKIYRHFAMNGKTLGDYAADYDRKTPVLSIQKKLQDKQLMEQIKNILPKIKSRGLKQIAETKGLGLGLERMGGSYMRMGSISYEESLGQLKGLIGLQSVKDFVEDLFNKMQLYGRQGDGSLHLVFSGNPGTGKTEAARLMGQIFMAQGILRRGHVVEVDKSKLVSNHVGESAIKTRQKCEEALDGVLFFDEAYSLVNTEEGSGEKFASAFDKEAYETLMKFMEDHRDRICVICAGYTGKMEKFLDANDGMRSRFGGRIIIFPDYTADELFDILSLFAGREGFRFDAAYETGIKQAIKDMVAVKDEKFGNARDMRVLFDNSKTAIANRMAGIMGKYPKEEIDRKKYLLTSEDIPDEYKKKDVDLLYTQAIAELNSLIGLKAVKDEIKTIYNRVKHLGDLKTPGHYVFMGNPGTGKTEVAKIMSRLLKSLGLLKKGHVVEARRDKLVGAYQGHSAKAAIALCKEALGGVLFVDEAYRLTNDPRDTFGREAYEAIMEFMENNRDKFSVVFAGYKEEMLHFMQANPGMESRISKKILFEDYTAEELLQILELMAKAKKYTLDESYTNAAKRIFDNRIAHKPKNYANARDVRGMLDKSIGNLANRLAEASDCGIIIPDGEKRTLIRIDLGGYLEKITNKTEEQNEQRSHLGKEQRMAAGSA